MQETEAIAERGILSEIRHLSFTLACRVGLHAVLFHDMILTFHPKKSNCVAKCCLAGLLSYSLRFVASTANLFVFPWISLTRF
jgi:hypothetical protein